MALINLTDANYTVKDTTKDIYLKLELINLQSSSTAVTDATSIILQQTAGFSKQKLGSGLNYKNNSELLEVLVNVFKYYIDPGNSILRYSIIESADSIATNDQPGTLIKEIDPAVADLQNNIVSYSFNIFFN